MNGAEKSFRIPNYFIDPSRGQKTLGMTYFFRQSSKQETFMLKNIRDDIGAVLVISTEVSASERSGEIYSI